MSQTIQIADKAVLASLHITRFQDVVKDQMAAKKFAEVAEGAEARFKVYKDLLERTGAYGRLTKLLGRTRNFHLDITFPTQNKGWRVLFNSHIVDWDQRLTADAMEAEKLLIEMHKELPGQIDRARQRDVGLGKYFREDDYPSAEEIVEKFTLSREIKPITSGADISRLFATVERDTKASVDEVRRIAEETISQVSDGLQTVAMSVGKDIRDRITEELGHLIERLTKFDPDNRLSSPFRDSTIGNIKRLSELIDGWNFTDDPVLTEVNRDIKSKLANLEPGVLRTSPNARDVAKADAEKILKQVGNALSF